MMEANVSQSEGLLFAIYSIACPVAESIQYCTKSEVDKHILFVS